MSIGGEIGGVAWCEQLVELTGVEMTMLVMALRVSEELSGEESDAIRPEAFARIAADQAAVTMRYAR